jgi:hypothetical protein
MTTPFNTAASLANIDPKNPIYKYCMLSCANAIPLSKKKSGLNTSTNNTAMSCRMAYAARIKTYGTTNPSGSYPKKTCSIGGPTFSY